MEPEDPLLCSQVLWNYPERDESSSRSSLILSFHLHLVSHVALHSPRVYLRMTNQFLILTWLLQTNAAIIKEAYFHVTLCSAQTSV
jgi:hypothetical protein